MSDVARRTESLARAAKAASREVALAPSATRAQALVAAAAEIRADTAGILQANAVDVADATAAGLAPALVDRLRLDPARLSAIADACAAVAALPDPVGEVMESWERPNGLRFTRRRVPLGLVAIVYESRPNVTVDAAALCLRAGNACVLRGGSEALRSNVALAAAFGRGVAAAGLPAAAVTLLPFADREAVPTLGGLRGVVDLIIPRGGPGLIEAVTSTARVPVVRHDAGICHIYAHAAADLAMAESIVVNAKCQRPGVCNAAETLLVDAALAPRLLPRLAAALTARGTEIRACPQALPLMPGSRPASEADWSTEHLALILNVRVVPDAPAAAEHIARYGSGHSDAIVTEDAAAARSFLDRVDSACVYWNASTRFTDGAAFGFGAEVGISTDRLHARGPMGLRELTTWKTEIIGTGQVRA